MVGAASSDPLPQATDCFALERCCLKDKQDITFTITAKDHVVSLTERDCHHPVDLLLSLLNLLRSSLSKL